MSSKPLKKAHGFFVTAVFCLISIVVSHGQGFGGFFSSKMDVDLKRKHPPQIYLMNTAISIKASSLVPSSSLDAQRIVSVLESELFSNDKRLRSDNLKPETLISCELTQFDLNDKSENRKSTERQKVGDERVWNKDKQRYDTRPVYKDVAVVTNYKIIRGVINVSYQVKDVSSGSILDSDNIRFPYAKEFPEGRNAPSLNEVEELMIRAIVIQIVHRIVPTTESMKVMLPKGKLEQASKLGRDGLWSRMLETLETMAPLKTPKDDSYREYGIGVAYEALAYQAEDLSTTRSYLEKSAARYGKAIDMKSDEKHFREPLLRIQKAITQYKKLEDQQAAFATAQAQKQPKPAPAPTPAQQRSIAEQRDTSTSQLVKDAGQPQEKPLTNQDIIELASGGLDEANLLMTIKEARAVQFDLRPPALSTLLKNKVSNRVITAMRSRQEAPRSTAPQRRVRRN